ncbi:MAG: AI-2E family transporter [Candidatus Aenigmarchaeota archaeon]|nr:AI-2E family transporter [Candidatus Aenigmarchaeota archaeon]
MDRFISIEKVLLVVFVILGAIMISPFYMPVLLAAISAYVMFPLVNTLRKFFKSYHFALVVSITMIAIPFVLLIAYSINDITPLVHEITGLSQEINTILEPAEEFLSQYGLSKFAVNIQAGVTGLSEYMKAQMLSFVFTIPMLILHITIYFFSTYYFLKDGSGSIKFFKRYINTLEYREKRMIQSIMTGLKNSFDVLFLSYITISVLVTIFAWIGFNLIGIPYPAILALLAGIFGFLPLLGIWIVYTGIGIFMFLQGDMTSALLVIGFGAIFLNIIPDLFIRPILGSKAGKVHPMTIVIGFFGGPLVFGVNGFLIGPIVLVIAETVLVSYMNFYIDVSKEHN